MLLNIPALLTKEEISEIKRLLNGAEFVDGKLTASGAAQKIKNNEQLQVNSQALTAINYVLQGAINSSPLLRESTFVKHLLPFIISRYLPGMEYGWHVDSPLMGGAEGNIRTDLSITIFLNNPEEYEGGELEIEGDGGMQKYKLQEGAAIVYPTTKIHRVAPVISGQRLVAVSWMQSYVKLTEHRDLLFQMKSIQEILNQQQQGSGLHLLAQQVYSNLLRMLSEA